MLHIAVIPLPGTNHSERHAWAAAYGPTRIS